MSQPNEMPVLPIGTIACSMCEDKEGLKDHTCSRKEELYHDETLCNCCDECTYDCRRSI